MFNLFSKRAALRATSSDLKKPLGARRGTSLVNAIEPLESRTLLSAAVVGVYTGRDPASETDPTGDGRGSFIIKRAVRNSKTVTVQYYVAKSSTARNGVDFQTLTGTVTIPARKYSVLVHILPIDDSLVEGQEKVTLVVKPGAYTIGHPHADVKLDDNDSASSGWLDNMRRYRTSFTFDSGSFARSDEPIDHAINFTSVLSDLSASGPLVDHSIRVVETDAAGTSLVDGNVPFQFDKNSDFDAQGNAAGDLIVQVKGNTAANTTRYYQVYFDTTGSFSAPSVTPLVTTNENDSDEGMDAIKIDTQTATYWLQKANGGFSSIEDKSSDHNDWLGFNPTSGSQSGGEFRGTPNSVYPGGGFHAGFTTGTTELIASGPLKTTIESTLSVDKQISGSPFTYKMRYEIYGKFVRATMLQADDSYWFLYEGTPGGSVDGNDTVVRSDGTTTDISTSWNDNDGLGNGADAAASGSDEFAYFRDSAVGKYMYFVHNQADNLKDSYYRMDANGSMTVFGFGRDNDVSDPDREKMTDQNNVFTFGIADGGSNFNSTASAIRGVYKDVSISDGASGTKPS